MTCSKKAFWVLFNLLNIVDSSSLIYCKFSSNESGLLETPAFSIIMVII